MAIHLNVTDLIGGTRHPQPPRLENRSEALHGPHAVNNQDRRGDLIQQVAEDLLAAFRAARMLRLPVRVPTRSWTDQGYSQAHLRSTSGTVTLRFGLYGGCLAPGQKCPPQVVLLNSLVGTSAILKLSRRDGDANRRGLPTCALCVWTTCTII